MNFSESALSKIDLSRFEVDKPQWYNLRSLWNEGSIRLYSPFRPDAVDVVEKLQDKTLFWYQRSMMGPHRITTVDRYGLIGLSMVNIKDTRAIVAEGVSDFLSLKMLYPTLNVLGFTTLGGNINSVKILLSLFESFTFVCDNDFTADRNTGMLNGAALKQYYESYGRQVKIVFPEFPYKDITQQLMAALELRKSEI